MAKAEGRSFQMIGIKNIQTDFLETFNFISPEQLIETETHEFSAVCPFSGLPDIATLIIKYKPVGGLCVELKSLKYYLTSFRLVGLYQEGCTKRIYTDLKTLLKTECLQVKTIYNTRGGFITTCTEGIL